MMTILIVSDIFHYIHVNKRWIMDHKREDNQTILQHARENVEKCRKGRAKIRWLTADGKPARQMEVGITQKTQDFLFGNLVFDLVWPDQVYRPDLFKERFMGLFNMAIFPFYWPGYEPRPGMTQWARMLPALEWCKAHGVTPKGHPLVWPYTAGVPEWLYDMPEDTVEPLIRSRVTDLVSGYREDIRIWDVTNEAVNHISWAEATNPAFRSRYHEITMWRGLEVSGAFKREIPIREAAGWVEDAFRWAYAANPQATLILNDYNQEIDPNIRQRFFDLAVELKTRGVPLSGLGLQVHPIDYWLWPEEIWQTLEMYAELNIPIHITELQQPSWDHEIEGGWREGRWNEAAQAEYVEQLYRLFFGHPSVVSINYWGLSDHNIWVPGAGLIDSEYKPKPAYQALKKLIKGEWMTPPAQYTTGDDGCLDICGFFGEYELALKLHGKQVATYRIHMAQNEENDRVFTLPY
jgi:endo-1,4-beta-xylanase